MKILLSYSYYHFDPDKLLSQQPERNSSAGILARTFYEVLSEMGEVTYTDASRYKEHLGNDFDLFVGIASHFHDVIKANLINVKQSIYVAVNMHPLERNKILKQALKDLDLPDSAISEKDIVDPAPYIEAMNLADFILCVGNNTTFNSYIKHGIPKSKIKLINYGLIDRPKPSLTKPAEQKHYVYTSSEIGLRKGFDLLYELMSNEQVKKSDFKLDIVGPLATDYHKQKLEKLGKILGRKMKYHGWMNSSSKGYEAILSKADFLLFPSLEEGQAGTIIDAIARGVIPIISTNSGVDYSPLGNFAISGDRRLASNIELLLDSLRLNSQEVVALKHKSVDYYKEFHENFSAPIHEALSNALRGCIYPKVSFTLAIYNKEPTILDLVEYLDGAIKQYPSAELHVIFDGCTDKTEKLVRKYYHDDPGYQVSFSITPNIFEIKTNNLGLKKSTGKYCVIVQDDNYIYDHDFIYEAVNFLDKDSKAVVLGCLAGVNFYPRGTTGLQGKGQITINEEEVYWRQDANTDSNLKNRIFQVDACMRGPLFIRKSFLAKTGYLDEAYAPLYEDDMDLGMRAGSLGYKVYCILMDVENKSLSMAHADSDKSKLFARTMKRNTDIFYKRWKPSVDKDYSWVNRTKILKVPELALSKSRTGFGLWQKIIGG